MYLRMNRMVKVTFRYASILVLFFYLIVPIVYYNSHSLQRYLIFRNTYELPEGLNFSNPERENLNGAYNRYIPSSYSGLIGMWQVLPSDVYSQEKNGMPKRDGWFLEQLRDERPVVLYCHGNYPSRATDHRILVLKLLQELNFHVISFDYRGFADSSIIDPSEESVTNDVIDVLNWIRSYSSSPLYLWAHSLGTGISLSALSKVCDKGACVDALVLQSGFNSIADEVHLQSFSSLYMMWPFFDRIFIKPLHGQDIKFNSQENILHVTCPILILHAEDDVVVPFSLGKKLFEFARSNQAEHHGQVKVKFVPFSKEYGYGHNGIVNAPELPVIIKKFFDEATNGIFSP